MTSAPARPRPGVALPSSYLTGRVRLPPRPRPSWIVARLPPGSSDRPLGRGLRWSTFILTGLLAGLRWGESAALYRSDIDWARGRLHVQRTYAEKGRRIEPCKDHEDRWVKASPALLAALRDHLSAMELEGQVKEWTPEQRQLVFPALAGRMLRYSYFLEDAWTPLLSRAGLPYRKYHSTRHTYATWLLSDGADLRWVQHQLGHSTVAQTADTYGHLQPERNESAAAGLDRYVL